MTITCVKAVFQHFFEGRDRTLNDFSSCNAVDDMLLKPSDSAKFSSECRLRRVHAASTHKAAGMMKQDLMKHLAVVVLGSA